MRKAYLSGQFQCRSCLAADDDSRGLCSVVCTAGGEYSLRFPRRKGNAAFRPVHSEVQFPDQWHHLHPKHG